MFGNIANWIYLGLAAYLVLVVVVGLYFSRGIKECDDHVVGGRDISFVYLVGSTAATWLCAGAILGAAGYAYMFGFQGTIYDPWAPALTLVLAGIFFVYRLRQAGYTSVVDFYDNRYGKRMSVLYMIIQIIGTMAWLAGQMVAAGVLVQVTTGFSFAVSVIIGTIAVIILTYTGGLKALSRLDTMNTVLIIVALVILFPAVIRGIGGWEYFRQQCQGLGQFATFFDGAASGCPRFSLLCWLVRFYILPCSLARGRPGGFELRHFDAACPGRQNCQNSFRWLYYRRNTLPGHRLDSGYDRDSCFYSRIQDRHSCRQ